MNEFIRHVVMVGDRRKVHMFAVVAWNVKYRSDLGYLRPASVYLRRKYEAPAFNTYMPVQRLNCQYIALDREVGGVNVSIVMPIEKHLVQY